MPFCLLQISAVISKLPFSSTHVVVDLVWYSVFTIANSRETNKQLQLQKQAQYFSFIVFMSSSFISFISIYFIYSIYYQLRITNKWACNVLNWNHSFIWKAKKVFFKNVQLATKVATKPPITCGQNIIGEMEKEKGIRASKGSSNIATFIE